MAKEGVPSFEIPAEVRAFAEKSVEQAKQAFESFIAATQHAANTAENQAASARNGAKEVGELAVRFTERNIASSFEFAQKLVKAKDSDTIRRMVAALTEPFRETFVLREIENLSYREIANVAEVPVGTVMSRLARARAMLRSAWLAEQEQVK